MPNVALILLAAGGSTRMGETKQLMAFGSKTLIQYVVDTGLASRCRPIIVVLGAAAEKIGPTLAGQPIEIVVNNRWREGMGTSIAAGIEVARKCGAAAAILALADQPLITAAILDHLIELQASSRKSIVTAEYAGTVGVPVLFGRYFFPNLLSLPPSQGCKGLILDHPDDLIRIPCPEAEMDVDTPDDYGRWCALNAKPISA